ncbi:hypothetical protein C5167_004286 [Papaver somniferum]|nr:hypothetical protein C5167_004286 [Papaver somniferum]
MVFVAVFLKVDSELPLVPAAHLYYLS